MQRLSAPLSAMLLLLSFAVNAQTSSNIASDASNNAENNTSNNEVSDTTAVKSPWIITPLISINPKLSTSAGALAGYMYKFDPESPASMFGFTGNYSKTKSWTAVAFTKSYFDEGRQRVTAAVMQGKINNDYDDYLGTGVSVDTTDHLNFFILRYTHRLLEHWYLGGQVLNSNYAMTGPNPEVQTIIDAAGLGGFESIGAGLVLEYDSKNRQRSASAGKYFVLHNIAYRKSFGGDVSFDTYEMKYTEYFANGPHVLAMNFHGRWTHNAPPSGYSSVYTKGYTRGQYLAPHISSLELDQRFAFNKHWGMSVYGAAACLYGKDGSEDANLSQSNEKSDCSNRENWYPSAATGIIYTLKPEQGIVIRADLAVGKGDNNGFYLSFGQPF